MDMYHPPPPPPPPTHTDHIVLHVITAQPETNTNFKVQVYSKMYNNNCHM